MPPRKDDTSSHALGHALRYLRHERHLTQDDVVARVEAAGGSISKIYYSLLERGRNEPSGSMRIMILRALGSSEDELLGLLAARPWGERGEPRLRMRPEESSGVFAFSSPAFGLAGRMAAGALASPSVRRQRRSAAEVVAPSYVPSLSEPEEAVLPSEEGLPSGLSELVERYRRLDHVERKQLLRQARELEGRRERPAADETD